MNKIERVAVRSQIELRGGSGKSMKLGGYASVFEQTTDLGWMGQERMARGSMDAALADKDTDVRALFNHDSNMLLGRQSAGTLRLSADSHGLEYEVDLPDTTVGRDVRELVERGDLDGASFAFIPGEWSYDEKSTTRTHTSVRSLIDVSPVVFPAYAGASTEARSLIVADQRRSQLVRARARVEFGRN